MKCLRQDDSLPIWNKELNVNHADDFDVDADVDADADVYSDADAEQMNR